MKMQKSFDKKMISFISKVLIISTLIILAVAAMTTTISITDKSLELARSDAEMYAETIETGFNSYYETMISLMLDANVQKYVTSETTDYQLMDNIYRVLDNICNMQSNTNFISVILEGKTANLIKGEAIPNWVPNYQQKILEEYQDGLLVGRGNMRMRITDSFDIHGQYTLSIYCPVYSSVKIGKELGIICFNVDDPRLQQISRQKDHSSYLIHKSGIIMINHDDKRNNQSYRNQDLFASDTDSMISNGSLMIAKELNRWDFYYVVEMSFWEIVKSSLSIVLALILLLFFLIIVVIQSARNIVTEAYRPWGKVAEAMREVSGGELSTRLNTQDIDPDMMVISSGFNRMMEEMIRLMEKSREEQQQMSKIKMEALQSQIQPHFLYNTLDCIRWQAVASDNREVAQMTKALASYYRICLSKGKDIITLKQEIEYIRNYLYLQQIRYGDILNYTIDMPEQLADSLIPKMTIQPLVENAIYHGLKKIQSQSGMISIKAVGDEKVIKILVEDNGAGMTEEEIVKINELIQEYDSDFGYGIRNVNRRLQLYYGRQYGLTYMSNSQGGITARIMIPNELERKEDW